MLSGNGVKTVRCPYNALRDPLRLMMLSGNGAHTFWAGVNTNNRTLVRTKQLIGGFGSHGSLEMWMRPRSVRPSSKNKMPYWSQQTPCFYIVWLVRLIQRSTSRYQTSITLWVVAQHGAKRRQNVFWIFGQTPTYKVCWRTVITIPMHLIHSVQGWMRRHLNGPRIA